jgi:hypothetical protein
MRSLFGLFAIALISVCLTACGGAGKGAGSAPRASSHAAAARETPATMPATTPASEPPGLHGLRGDEDDDDTPGNHTTDTSHDNDADFDNDSKASESKAYHDSDDGRIANYGQAADAADSRAVTALVKRYYAAAAASDGARACALMYSIFAEAIPEDYGRGAGPRISRGNTCAVVMSKLFKHNHGRLAGAIVVTGVRVSANQGRALIGSETIPASYLFVKRERGIWKVDALFGQPLP